MTVVMSILSAFFLLFGLLALPYSIVIAGVSVLVAAGIAFRVLRRPEARRTALSVIAVMGVVGVGGYNFALLPYMNTPVVSDVTTFNAEGEAGRVFVVYHPGRSDLQEQAVTGFVDGLVEAGWRVELTTASDETPADLRDYDLLVLGAQTYNWTPAQPIKDFVRRVGDLDGLVTVAIISGLGETTPADDDMRALIADANGTLLTIYNVWQMRPIDEVYGTSDPHEAMHSVVAELELP